MLAINLIYYYLYNIIAAENVDGLFDDVNNLFIISSHPYCYHCYEFIFNSMYDKKE